MDELMAAEGFRFPAYAYWLLLAAFFCLCAFFLYRRMKKERLKRRTWIAYLLAAVPLALFFGRLVYSAVRYDWMYLDEMGNFAGVLPFIDVNSGGVNAVGIVLGCLLAGWITARITRQPAGLILDCVVPFGVLLFALARFVEPITGQGFGDLLDRPLLPFYPFGIMNGWGEWQLPVCAVEGLLALLAFGALMLARNKTKTPGTLALYGLALLSASQIIPQSLRQDDVLMIFVFARINQIGYVALLCGAMFYAGARALRRGAAKRAVLLEWAAMAAGVLLAIGCEFALDKTNLPDLLVYAVMALALAGMCALTLRRIHRGDVA